MTKEEFIKRVSKQTRLPQTHVSDILNASHRLLEEIMRGGGKVTFPGFGTFYTSQRKAGKVKHIKTGRALRDTEVRCGRRRRRRLPPVIGTSVGLSVSS